LAASGVFAVFRAWLESFTFNLALEEAASLYLDRAGAASALGRNSLAAAGGVLSRVC
jgi:uncharacterized phage protein gp47/JayE